MSKSSFGIKDWRAPTGNVNFPPHVLKHGDRILALMKANGILANADAARRVRIRLNEYLGYLPPKKRALPLYAIWLLKREVGNLLPKDSSSDGHPISDHALVRTMERLWGMDVKQLKDKAMTDLANSKMVTPKRNGIIVTVLS